LIYGTFETSYCYEDREVVAQPLFCAFASEFADAVPDLPRTFRLNRELLGCVCDVFTDAALVGQFAPLGSSQQQLGAQFSAALVDAGTAFNISEYVERSLTRIVQSPKN
jgi:hypothetical protein